MKFGHHYRNARNIAGNAKPVLEYWNPDFIKTLPELMREHGYYTTNNYKTDSTSPGVQMKTDETLCMLEGYKDGLNLLADYLNDNREWLPLQAAISVRTLEDRVEPIVEEIRQTRLKYSGDTVSTATAIGATSNLSALRWIRPSKLLM